MTKAKWHDAKTERPPRPNLYLVCGTYLPTRTSGMMTCRWNGEKWEAAIQIRVTDWTPLPPPPSRDYIAFPVQGLQEETDLHHGLHRKKGLGQIPDEERKTKI